VAVPAGETVRLAVGEVVPGEARFVLTNSDEDQLALILNETGHNTALVAALDPVLAARRAEADAEDTVDKVNKQIESLRADEDRQRSNVTALAAADKASRDRFVHDLNMTEDKIAAAQKDLAAAQTAQQNAQDDLDKKIEAIQLDEKL
jgi:phage shock protein A